MYADNTSQRFLLVITPLKALAANTRCNLILLYVIL